MAFLDKHRRVFFHRYFLKKRILKSLQKNNRIPLYVKYYAMFAYSGTPFNSNYSRFRNRCIRSGRQYNVIRRTQTCRFVFRFESYEGLLPGLRRSSW